MNKITITMEFDTMCEARAYTNFSEMRACVDTAHSKLRSILKYREVPDDLSKELQLVYSELCEANNLME